VAKPPVDSIDPMEEMGLEASHLRRRANMRRLLRQWFKEEFESTRIHLRPIKGKMLITILSICAVVLFGFTVINKFNKMVAMEEEVFSMNGRVINALQLRTNLYANLVNLTLNHAALEQEVFRHVADVRSSMRVRDSKQDPASRPSSPSGGMASPGSGAENVAANGAASMTRLLALVERHPDIRSSVTYQQLMDKLVQMEDRIITRRSEYNNKVRIYNTYITTFPQYILADIIGFEIHRYAIPHETKVGDEFQLPSLSSPLFQRLLPQGTVRGTSSDSLLNGPSTPVEPIGKP